MWSSIKFDFFSNCDPSQVQGEKKQKEQLFMDCLSGPGFLLCVISFNFYYHLKEPGSGHYSHSAGKETEAQISGYNSRSRASKCLGGEGVDPNSDCRRYSLCGLVRSLESWFCLWCPLDTECRAFQMWMECVRMPWGPLAWWKIQFWTGLGRWFYDSPELPGDSQVLEHCSRSQAFLCRGSQTLCLRSFFSGLQAERHSSSEF